MSNLTETKEGEWLAICPRFKPFNYYKTLYELFEENTELKKLLKECQGSIATLLSKRITEVNGIKQKELLAKIEQALGEDKKYINKSKEED